MSFGVADILITAAALIIFPVVCTDAGLLFNYSAHITEMMLWFQCFSWSTKGLQLRKHSSKGVFSRCGTVSNIVEVEGENPAIPFKRGQGKEVRRRF